jgi:hypothetical protein
VLLGRILLELVVLELATRKYKNNIINIINTLNK